MEYKIGDIISVPKHGDLEINKEVLYLFEGFLKYDTKYCIILIKGYSEGYPYLLNLDIKIFLHFRIIFHSYNICMLNKFSSMSFN